MYTYIPIYTYIHMFVCGLRVEGGWCHICSRRCKALAQDFQLWRIASRSGARLTECIRDGKVLGLSVGESARQGTPAELLEECECTIDYVLVNKNGG